jgi:hypothetical protein
MYQDLSAVPSFWICEPTVGAWVQVSSGQCVGSVWPLYFFQCSSQLPHLQVSTVVPLMLFTFTGILQSRSVTPRSNTVGVKFKIQIFSISIITGLNICNFPFPYTRGELWTTATGRR